MFSPTSRRAQNSSYEEAYAGPDPNFFTPPASPSKSVIKRVKREKGRSSSGEEFLSKIPLTIEDHRCAGPLSVSVPRRLSSVSSEVGSIWKREKLDNIIATILFDHKLDWDSFNAFKLQSDEQTIESVVVVVLEDLISQNWIKATESIWSACQSHGLHGMNVELVNQRGTARTISSPISTNESLVRDWADVQPKILQLLLPNMSWMYIDVLGRGKEFRNVQGESTVNFIATIVIRIERHSTESWTRQRDAIDEFLQSHEAYKNFAVEIIRSSCVQAFCSLNEIRAQDYHLGKQWQSTAYLGASIGRTKSDFVAGSESCGCFLSVRWGSTTKSLALTNFHVAFPLDSSEPAKGQPEHVDRWIKCGFAPGEGESYDLTLNMPTRIDYENFLKEQEALVKDLERNKIGAYSYLEIRDLDLEFEAEGTEGAKGEDDEHRGAVKEGEHLLARMPKNVVHTYIHLKKSVANYQKRMNEARTWYEDSDNPVFGQVYAGSGLRVSQELLMDWALVEVRPNRVPERNEVCLFSPPLVTPPGYAPFTDLTKQIPSTDTYLFGVYPPETGETVYKIGRTTGVTKGTVNELQSTKNLKGWEVQGKNQFRYRTAQVWTILSKPKEKLFCEPGDSGSAIFTLGGNFKGLLVGGFCELNQDVAYFISGCDIFEDIKEITGADEVDLLQKYDK
jgi:hypothetical protein